MIRPFTFVTLMLACTSGAYLFVVKHRTAALDTQISSVTGQIRAAEQRIRVLRAEWALENDPSQLAALSKQFLKLQPMAPDQLTSIQRLADILPPPGAGIPTLPLPPPPSWAVAPAPPQSNPASNPITNSPIASAAPAAATHAAPAHPVETALASPPLAAPKPIPPAPLRLAAAQPERLAANQAPLHHPVPAARRVPPQHPQDSAHYAAAHYTVPHAAHSYAPHDRFAFSARPIGAPVMAVTAERAPLHMAPRLTAAQPYRGRPAQSVFGNFGADLPPPQPVFRSPQ
jgi:hypothetical protein